MKCSAPSDPRVLNTTMLKLPMHSQYTKVMMRKPRSNFIATDFVLP